MGYCGTAASKASAQAYESCGVAQGLLDYPGAPVPDDSQYRLVALRNKPAGAPQDFPAVCEAMLRARGLIYWKNNPGDCGAPPPPQGFSSGQIVGLSGAAASGVVGGLGAVGTISGAATLGISTAVTLAVAGIESVFAHHAQAVANEQATICAVAGYFNPLIRQIDAAVRSGQISPSQGVTYMQQVAQQAINGLAGIVKTCNASCVYQAILKAHIDFANYFYNAIAPSQIYPNNPGSAPTTYGTPPGGVTANGTMPNPAPPVRATAANVYAPAIPNSSPPLISNALLPGPSNTSSYLNTGYNQQTGQSAQAADVPPVNWSMWAALAAIVAAFVAVLSFAGKRTAAA
jgi:hypothetical protein